MKTYHKIALAAGAGASCLACYIVYRYAWNRDKKLYKAPAEPSNGDGVNIMKDNRNTGSG